MCTGRVDLAFILRAFLNGTDGVFIGGCWPGECHYSTDGNYHALSMVHLCRKLLGLAGVNPERLRLEWVSAAQGTRFAELVNDFVRKVKKLGPLFSDETDENELMRRMEAVNRLIPYIKLVERERLRVRFSAEEEYDKYFSSSVVNKMFKELISDKLAVNRIIFLLREKPLSIAEISDILGLKQAEVSGHLNSSAMQGLVRFDEGLRRFALA
jgi:coenzyme F420-reducing hydrogenase delta subunit